VKPEDAKFADYRKAEHFAEYCKMHGIRQGQKASSGILDFMGAETSNAREKELLDRYEKYGASWRLWTNPAWRDHKRREHVLELADKPRAQHWQLRVYAAAHGEPYADDVRQWLRDQDALAEITEEGAAWVDAQDYTPYRPGYVSPYSLEAKRAREAKQASSEA
jgi:hypothetical protein